MGQFQNSVDDSGVPADKTKHREDHQDYDKHDGPHKDPVACRDLLHIRLPDGVAGFFCLLGRVHADCRTGAPFSVSEFQTDPLPIFFAVTPAG
jgi:hypothetical protein